MVIVLIALVVLQSSMKWVIVAYYQLNKSYIANNLCQNKAKPQLKCNGKCYLTKKLKAQDKQEQKSNSVLKAVEYVAQSIHYAVPASPVVYKNTTQVHTGYSIAYYKSPDLSIFQPPRL